MGDWKIGRSLQAVVSASGSGRTLSHAGQQPPDVDRRDRNYRGCCLVAGMGDCVGVRLPGWPIPWWVVVLVRMDGALWDGPVQFGLRKLDLVGHSCGGARKDAREGRTHVQTRTGWRRMADGMSGMCCGCVARIPGRRRRDGDRETRLRHFGRTFPPSVLACSGFVCSRRGNVPA